MNYNMNLIEAMNATNEGKIVQWEGFDTRARRGPNFEEFYLEDGERTAEQKICHEEINGKWGIVEPRQDSKKDVMLAHIDRAADAINSLDTYLPFGSYLVALSFNKALGELRALKKLIEEDVH